MPKAAYPGVSFSATGVFGPAPPSPAAAYPTYLHFRARLAMCRTHVISVRRSRALAGSRGRMRPGYSRVLPTNGSRHVSPSRAEHRGRRRPRSGARESRSRSRARLAPSLFSTSSRAAANVGRPSLSLSLSCSLAPTHALRNALFLNGAPPRFWGPGD
jgi:hypothetical protein